MDLYEIICLYVCLPSSKRATFVFSQGEISIILVNQLILNNSSEKIEIRMKSFFFHSHTVSKCIIFIFSIFWTIYWLQNILIILFQNLMQSAVYSMNTGISSTKKMIALYFSNIFYDTMSDFSPRPKVSFFNYCS